SGRTQQKARTRAALLQAAVALVREGSPPSMPGAAERALVSVATSYRYFPTAEELWSEASSEAIATAAAAGQHLDDAGNDPQARLDALLRDAGFRMFDDQVPYRQLTKSAMELWFRQLDTPECDRVPVREGRRNAQIRRVLAPLEDRMPKKDLDRIAR